MPTKSNAPDASQQPAGAATAAASPTRSDPPGEAANATSAAPDGRNALPAPRQPTRAELEVRGFRERPPSGQVVTFVGNEAMLARMWRAPRAKQAAKAKPERLIDAVAFAVLLLLVMKILRLVPGSEGGSRPNTGIGRPIARSPERTFGAN
jgi:hypothetical protein